MSVLVRWCYNVTVICHSVGRVPRSYPRCFDGKAVRGRTGLLAASGTVQRAAGGGQTGGYNETLAKY